MTKAIERMAKSYATEITEDTRDKSVVTVTFWTAVDSEAKRSAMVDWWCESQERWRGQAFRMKPGELLEQLRAGYPQRKVVVREGAP